MAGAEGGRGWRDLRGAVDERTNGIPSGPIDQIGESHEGQMSPGGPRERLRSSPLLVVVRGRRDARPGRPASEFRGTLCNRPR